MKKRILSILLALCMVMCAISPVMSYADPGVSASGSSAYGALLTPDTTPPAGWAEDESNPYGTKKGQPFAITPWYEPIIYSYRNAEGQSAQDHTKVYDKLTLGKKSSSLRAVHTAFPRSIMSLSLSAWLTIRSARAETITLSLLVFAIWIIPRTRQRSATGYKIL